MIEFEEDVHSGVINRTIHSTCGKKCWCDVGGIRNAQAVTFNIADQLSETITKSEEVEHRFNESRENYHPGGRFECDVTALKDCSGAPRVNALA